MTQTVTATNSSFDQMLNQYLTYDLLKTEAKKRSWLWDKVRHDEGWKNGSLVVPFESAGASSISFGALTADTDVQQANYVRGSISGYKEVWGTMQFNQKDIAQHDGKVNEKSFLKILPGKVESFTNMFVEKMSQQILSGAAQDVFLANGDIDNTGATVTGAIYLNRPERFQLGEKITIDDDNSSPLDCYIISINLNTKVILVSTTAPVYTTAGGVVHGSATSISAYTTAQNAKIYAVGGATSGNEFTSLKSSLLPATLASVGTSTAGATNLYGVAKTASPYTQAIAIDSSAVNASNILAKIFDAFTVVRQIGKGMPNQVVMSWKHLGSCMKLIELAKGAYKQTDSSKADVFGWTSISITGVSGNVTLVGIPEMDDDVIMFLDMSALCFHSNGGIRKHVNPDGNEFYTKRAITGYSYFVDLFLFGDLVVSAPRKCGIMYNIPNYTLVP